MADGDNGKIYAKLDDHDRRITQLESTRPFLRDLIDRSIKTNEKLSDTMTKIQESMIRLNDKIDKQSDEIKTMKSDLEDANKATNKRLTEVENDAAERIDAVNKKVDVIEKAGNFDMRDWLKKNFPWLIIIVGMGAMYAAQFVKF
jgi:methyl-accepting chemotaxis protein